jgi:hypothetical protein
MQTKTKVLSISTLVSAVLFLTLSAAQASVERTQAPNGGQVTKINVNGQFADTFLIDPDSFTNGSLDASKDQVTNTSALDFTYGTVLPTNPDEIILIQGAGAIPNSAFTITSTTAHLAVTVSNSDSFFLIRCVINQVAGTFECAPATDNKLFDLTWVTNGIGTVSETTQRVETLGPVTTKFKGSFTSRTADFSGTWDGHSSENLPVGNVRDSHSKTITREITVQPNP